MPDPYHWHHLAIAGKKPPIYTTPECGWFLHKSADGMIPSSIYWEGPTDENGDPCGDQAMHCEIGGVQVDPIELWLYLAKRPIPKEEYDQRLAEMF